MTYQAIPTPTRRFARTVRAIAAVDLVIAAIAAVPFTATALVDLIIRADGWLGFGSHPPPVVPSLILSINIGGVLAVTWALGRLAEQALHLARLDTYRRFAVAGLILYYVLLRGLTPVLVVLALAELAAAIVQGLAVRRFARTTGA